MYCTRFSKYFNDLEAAVFYKNKNYEIRWIDSMLESFETAQNAPKLPSATVILTTSDECIIFHDGCSVENRLNWAGLFSWKLKSDQALWHIWVKLKPWVFQHLHPILDPTFASFCTILKY